MFRRNHFYPSVSNEKALGMETDGRYLVGSSWSASLRHIKSELSLGKSLGLDGGNERKLIKMFSSLAVKVLLDQVTKSVMQVS